MKNPQRTHPTKTPTKERIKWKNTEFGSKKIIVKQNIYHFIRVIITFQDFVFESSISNSISNRNENSKSMFVC